MGAFVSRIFENIPFEYSVYISLGIFFVMWLFFGSRKRTGSFWGILQRAETRKPPPPKFAGEEACRQVLESYFRRKFHKERPDFLKNPETGRNLECDMINHELKLVVEYNGAQHYHFTPYFHRTEEEFLKQQKRDQFKYEKLKELGYHLIIVPYTVTDYRSFLSKEIEKLDLKVE